MKPSGSAASFNCTGAVRKAGFLSVKKWILRKKHQVSKSMNYWGQIFMRIIFEKNSDSTLKASYKSKYVSGIHIVGGRGKTISEYGGPSVGGTKYNKKKLNQQGRMQLSQTHSGSVAATPF